MFKPTPGQRRQLLSLGFTHIVVNDKLLAAFSNYYGALLYKEEIEGIVELPEDVDPLKIIKLKD